MNDCLISTEIFDTIVDRVNVGVIIIDRQFTIVYRNQFIKTYSNLEDKKILGKDLFGCFPELPTDWLKRKIKGVFMLNSFAFTSWQQRPYLFLFKHTRPISGGVEYMSQDCTLLPVKGEEGEVKYVCILVYDATDININQNMLTEAKSSLEQLSVRDWLTGIYNRRELDKRLSEEFSKARRYGSTFSFLLLDIDFFKKVNDQYGHLAGDHVLQCISKTISETVRDSDIVARYGGEEFAIIFVDTSMAKAFKVTERLRIKIKNTPLDYDGTIITVRISCGISEIREDITDGEALTREADNALYESKENGRNRTTCFRV